ncbi:hypothetical protein FisN_6Lh383 [Fistulifera solaris]|uniref:MD-2-related lipid-recognition domain-containing protein n=1 Tax=Fistulifera solaris TaxID=1519565 RepID=A0A1Z5JLF5_FISSO|nr:hypothetical protein FisN_6Lh383 [Fistulifera solaris]|eukprot:GAX14601.1 hypothetical protein FisN_6Lh383 [Fistulifera solaris]
MKYIVFVIALIGAAKALDVSIEEVVCDESLDVTAIIQMECNGGRRCAFGSTSRLYGTLYYKGVNYSGIQNNQAYFSVDLKFLTLEYKPFEMRQFQLCHGSLVQGQDSQSACPADGTYMYSISYKLPAAGGGHPVWLASGFQGNGVIRMYAEQDERMLIGECHLRLKTYVTRTDENTFGPLVTPSAAVTLGIVSAFMALVGLCCCYSRCCVRRRMKVQDAVSENESLFTRMEDDKIITTARPTKTNEFQHLSDTESASTISNLNSPRTQKTLQMPLM